MTRLHTFIAIGLVAVGAALAYRVGHAEPKRPDIPLVINTSAPTGAPETKSMTEYSKSAYRIAALPRDEVDRLASKLTDEQRRVMLDQGTEPAFCGDLVDNKKEGVYICRLCGLPLFSSDAKFHSGTGWPSFFKPFDSDHIREIADHSHGMTRTEIRCARCGGHLGHVFQDGPKPTGLRYCLNSASLEFIEKGETWPERSRPVAAETAYFAGGCFWGLEDHFQHVPGVIDAISGYQGGHTENPTYKQVCTDRTGHAETVQVVFDPARVSYRDLLIKFFEFHNPTTINRQGPDVGTQYRSAIFPANDEQKKEAEAVVAEQNKEGRWAGRVVTKIEPFSTFYRAEDYHQDYDARHGRTCPLP
ncbi:MAG: bifunctional methionine sulfoxide reductase B/A protein [Phycisphaeraceae bacterium]|nr:MAG: bifunctional methionine sulfoxide reductase B/A protein [Phycisphaeraceae bacterium]